MSTVSLSGTQYAGINTDLWFFELALSIAIFLNNCLLSAMTIFTLSAHSWMKTAYAQSWKPLLALYLYLLVLFTLSNLRTFDFTLLFLELFKDYSIVQEDVSIMFLLCLKMPANVTKYSVTVGQWKFSINQTSVSFTGNIFWMTLQISFSLG